MSLKKILGVSLTMLGTACAFSPAVQAAAPEPWQLWHQPVATPIMERVDSLHWLLLIISILICGLVLGLLVYAMLRFREKRNPQPSRTLHNTLIEVIWTVVPVVILVVIAVPSFRLLYFSDVVPKADMTIKATGHQWYWSYEYPDHGGIAFDSLMIPEADIQPGQKRLLEVDNRVVVPVDTTVRVITSAADVLHSWAIPAFGVKIDSVPGRLNETWFRVERPGVYYGQCSELCGVNHAYMPIAVEVVTKEQFEEWVQTATQKFAADAPSGATRVAQSRLSAR